MRSLQERNHIYARVHCERILSKEIKSNVSEMEARHAKERAAGNTTLPNRTPWRFYRQCILMALPKSTGLYELVLVLAMTREKGETAQQWMQRLDQGRTVVTHKFGGNNLSDGCYVELLLRGLGNKERGELIKAQVLRQNRDPYQAGVDVLVTSDGQAYRAKITCVDVEHEHVEGYDDPTEEWVELTRITPGLTNSGLCLSTTQSSTDINTIYG